MRRAVVMLAALACIAADVPPEAYVCRTYVTGTDERDRPAGLARCWAEVRTKVTGDPGPMAGEAVMPPEGAVAGIYYLDRLSMNAKHDEQGTRDRPHDLVARFAPGAVGSAWTGARPRLRMAMDMVRDGRVLALTADQPDDERARHILDDAAQRFGVVLSFDPADAEAMTVTGRLTWGDDGWSGAWSAGGRDWTGAAGSLSAAIRVGVLGALAVASGHADHLADVSKASLK